MTKQEVNAMYKQWMESYRGYGDEAVVACFFKALGYYRVSALDVADVIEDLIDRGIIPKREEWDSYAPYFKSTTDIYKKGVCDIIHYISYFINKELPEDVKFYWMERRHYLREKEEEMMNRLAEEDEKKGRNT